MSEVVTAAAEIVRGKMDDERLKTFLDTYAPGDNPVSKVLVWDHRVMVVGHSANKAACVAISASVQTGAAIGKSLRCVTSVDLYKTTNDEPVYDIVFKDGQRSRRIVAGIVASLAGIAKTAEGANPGSALVLSDHRKNIPASAPAFRS